LNLNGHIIRYSTDEILDVIIPGILITNLGECPERPGLETAEVKRSFEHLFDVLDEKEIGTTFSPLSVSS
jgi:hypothetical protein